MTAALKTVPGIDPASVGTPSAVPHQIVAGRFYA